MRRELLGIRKGSDGAEELRRAAFGKEAIANPRFGLDVFLWSFALEFFAELTDEDAKVFGLLGGLRAPDGGKQDAVGEDFAGVAREQEEQIEFL